MCCCGLAFWIIWPKLARVRISFSHRQPFGRLPPLSKRVDQTPTGPHVSYTQILVSGIRHACGLVRLAQAEQDGTLGARL